MDSRNIQRFAVFSDCAQYRYTLTRVMDPSKKGNLLYVMLNPSTADAYRDDPTITRCIVRAQIAGYGRCTIVNLFAYRATNPDALERRWALGLDVVGKSNDRYIVDEASKADAVVVAWGSHPIIVKREKPVLELLSGLPTPICCMGTTKDGHPRHPLYVKYTEDFQGYL